MQTGQEGQQDEAEVHAIAARAGLGKDTWTAGIEGEKEKKPGEKHANVAR